MTDPSAPADNKKGHQSPPFETTDGLRIVITELADGGLELDLDWEEGSPWCYLADLTAEEITEIAVTELARFVQEGDASSSGA